MSADGHNEFGRPRRAREVVALIPNGEDMPEVTVILFVSTSLHSLAQAVAWLAVILFMTAVGVAMTRKFRGDDADDEQQTNEMLTKFRDLHSRGGLSDEEYRTIKTKLAGQLQTELRDNDHTS